MSAVLVDAGGASVDMKQFFSAFRESLSTEYDAPTEFPTVTDSISVDAFDATTGVISVESALNFVYTLASAFQRLD